MNSRQDELRTKGFVNTLMNPIRWLGWRRCLFTLAVGSGTSSTVIETLSDNPVIALIIGEPWDAMRHRSTAEIGPAIPGQFWGLLPKSDARLRFLHVQY